VPKVIAPDITRYYQSCDHAQEWRPCRTDLPAAAANQPVFVRASDA